MVDFQCGTETGPAPTGPLEYSLDFTADARSS
jgi:hypothetical protein